MYSRYVPPKRGIPSKGGDNISTLRGNIVEPPSTAFLSIQLDASKTYARFVPQFSKPRISDTSTIKAPSHEPEGNHRKRKHEYIEDGRREPGQHSGKSKNSKETRTGKENLEQGVFASPIHSNGDSHPNSSEPPSTSRMKKKKDTKNDSIEGKVTTEIASSNEVDVSGDEDKRNKSILSKRAKSLKRAKKAAEKAETLLGNRDTVEPVLEEPSEIHPLEPLPQPKPVREPIDTPYFSALPEWLSAPIRVSPNKTAPFAEFGIQEEVIKILHSKGFTNAFAIQAAILPLLLPGDRKASGDILVSAATGSGKTLAYVLPMVRDISLSTVTRMRGLIVMPTRELVTQVRDVCNVCATAFTTSSRRVKVGIAVGNQQLKTEQSSLIKEERRYDPEEYMKQQSRIDAKWESSSVESDEYNSFYDEETALTLPYHVLEYSSKVDILICTPGRLVEHLKSTPGFTLDFVKWLVIDEADKLLDQSFQQWLEVLMSRLTQASKATEGINSGHSSARVTKIILSATMTRDLSLFSALKLYRPKFVLLEGREELTEDRLDNSEPTEVLSLPSTLKEQAVKVEDDSDKPLYLLELLNTKLLESISLEVSSRGPSKSITASNSNDNTSDSDSSVSEVAEIPPKATKSGYNPRLPKSRVPSAPRGVLIFTKSNENAARLSRLLQLLAPNYTRQIGTLTSTIRNSVRRHTLLDFQAGKVSILIASDLVARGLDLPNLAHVVNYDMPASVTSYIHRVGRTARAGKEGFAWTLFTNSEARWFWNEIARSKTVLRSNGAKVGRFNGIDAKAFGKELRKKYDDALAELGRETAAR
jgi:ATP-dependent RNA helicase DDX51/DBP6